MLSKNHFVVTRGESDRVFESFDADHDGKLSVYDFTSRATRDTYSLIQFDGPEAKLLKKHERVKNKKRTKGNSRSAFPSQAVFSFPMSRLITSFREKMELKAGSGETWSDHRAFRFAMEKARYFDRSRSGALTAPQLVRWLDTLDFPVPSQTVDSLMQRYPASTASDKFDYLEFLDNVYPQIKGKVGRTSTMTKPTPPASHSRPSSSHAHARSTPAPRRLQPMGAWNVPFRPFASTSQHNTATPIINAQSSGVSGSMTARGWMQHSHTNTQKTGSATARGITIKRRKNAKPDFSKLTGQLEVTFDSTSRGYRYKPRRKKYKSRSASATAESDDDDDGEVYDPVKHYVAPPRTRGICRNHTYRNNLW